MVIDGGEGSNKFLEPFYQNLCQLPFVLLFTASLDTLKPVDYPTFLGHLIFVLGGHQEVPDGDAPLKMYLDSHLNSYTHKLC